MLTPVTPKARCYMEYCCNTAIHHVESGNRSGDPGRAPIPWGWCSQHVSESWESRSATFHTYGVTR